MAQKTTTVESALRLAKSHAAKGNIEKAQHFYLMVLAKYPQNKKAKKGLKTLQNRTARETQPDLGQQEVDLAQKEVSGLIALYTAGDLNEALKEGKRLSRINPKIPLLHNTLGAIHGGLGELDAAVASYKRAVELKPDYAEAHYNLGNALRDLGQLDAAVASCELALKLAKKSLNELQNKTVEESPPELGHQKTDLTPQEINNVIALHSAGKLNEALKEGKRLSHLDPKVPLLHNTLGAIHAGLGQLGAAVKSYKQALELKPDYAEVHNNLGSALSDLGQLDAAVASYKRGLKVNPDYVEAHYNLGNAFRDLGQLDAAVISYERALELKPDYAEAHCNLGSVLGNLGQLDAAVASCDRALTFNPDLAEAHNNRGNALQDLEQMDAAVTSFERALKIKPGYAEAHSNLGNSLTELGQLDAAVASCKRALELKSDLVAAHYNLGNALRNLGQLDASVTSYEQALKIKPDHADAKFNLSYVQLLTGSYKAGWGNYESRWKTKHFESVRRYPQPFWDGQPVDGKVILVHAEQGIGDEVMFSSCISDLIDRHPKEIILECDHRLNSLFARSFPQVNIQAKRTKENHDDFKEDRHIDFQVAIGSLPRFFRPKLESFSFTQSFLKPNSDLLDKWINRFAELGHGIKIGISWRGSKEYSKRPRSTELQLWESVFQPGAHFVNLQYGDCVEEINQLKQSMGIHIHDWPDADPLKDLDNFAAQIAALDLVISIDNSTVHFAGAMGTPVWVLLPFSPEWRWLLDRNDSPWYPTARLFRQKIINDWGGVFNEVKQALKSLPPL